MKLIHKMTLAILITFLLSMLLDRGVVLFTKAHTLSVENEADLKYYKQAAKLSDILFKEGTPVRMQVVVDMLKNINKNLLVYYPKGPFTRNDFIALAWTESEFRQFETGTHGERGMFQIMPGEFSDFDIHKNYYDVDVNTRMAFRVLDGKYQRQCDYKRAIIAYNGLVYHKGKLSEKYWKAFLKRKIAVDLVLNDK